MPDESNKPAPTARRMPLPALVAIAFYMMLLAGFNLLGVVHGDIRPIYLIFTAAFITASLGLLKMFRWAWVMTLAAIVLMTGLFFYKFSIGHELSNIVQGLLNLIFFLYLIRTEVRERLV